MNEIFILHMKTFDANEGVLPSLGRLASSVINQFAVEGDGRSVPVQSSSG